MIPRRHLLTGLAALSLSVLVLGCGGGDNADGQAAQDTLTRRQKDSIISTLPVPGAGVVGKALEGMARQPEAGGQIQTAMFIGIAFAEAIALYALVVAFLLIFVA